MLKDGGMADAINDITVMNAELTDHLDEYTDMLYAKLQRRGSCAATAIAASRETATYSPQRCWLQVTPMPWSPASPENPP